MLTLTRQSVHENRIYSLKIHCGSFLLVGAAMYRRISISTVSMVNSRFQDAILGSLDRSTCAGKERVVLAHAFSSFF